MDKPYKLFKNDVISAANSVKNKLGWTFNKKNFVDSWLFEYHTGRVSQEDFYAEWKRWEDEG